MALPRLSALHSISSLEGISLPPIKAKTAPLRLLYGGSPVCLSLRLGGISDLLPISGFRLKENPLRCSVFRASLLHPQAGLPRLERPLPVLVTKGQLAVLAWVQGWRQ